jgi:hypothetical protein
MIHRLERKKRAVLRHPLMLAALLGSALVVAFAISGSAVATTATCLNAATLTGSAFEIDTDANLVVNSSGTCIDWLKDDASNTLRTGVLSKSDKPTGSGDDSFGQGTSENDANPTIVSGSIPPNKSDLKKFGLYQEAGEVTAGNPSGKYLELFWARVQSPQGTTNMDFELNKLFCDPSANPTNCAINSKDPTVTPETPVRSIGDKLITYDLSKGGTVPTISIRTWNGTVWGAATVISGGANPAALGSVNTSAIGAGASNDVGPLDPFTFGEVSLGFGQLFGTNTCGKFGSAYLKSRSSDSFTSEIKDFIGPQQVSISNCTTLTTSATASVTLTNPIKDTATLTGATATATGGITFKLYGPFDPTTDASTDTCVDGAGGNLVTTLGPVAIGSPNASGNYVVESGNYTPTAVGRYQWVASYSGDANNAAVSSACKDTGEASVVTKGNSSIATSQVLVPNDSAQVTPNTATGTITFYLFKPGQTCSIANAGSAVYTEAVTPLTTGGAITTNTSNTDALAGGVHADALGTWHWLVRYGGNGSLNGSDSVCTEAFTITES